MSFLADIHSYWASNATLNAALASTSVWTGLAPEPQSFPYAVVVPIANAPTFTTGKGYWTTFGFQISVYHTDPDLAESIAQTVADQFDYKGISSNTIACIRTNGPVFMVDPDSEKRVYHVMLEFDLLENLSLP